MTLTKRQRVIIWTFVIFAVILLGLDADYEVNFYGTTIFDYSNWVWGEEFLSGVADQKYLLIIVSAIISTTLIITEKKK